MTTSSEIVTYCGRCKLELAHNVLARLPKGNPAKVQCRTCQSIHKFRVKAEVKVKVRKVDQNKLSLTAVNQDEFYDEMTRKHKDSPWQPYSMNVSYQIGDRLQHPSLGNGVVMSLIEGKKIEVVFPTAIKVLVHNMPKVD